MLHLAATTDRSWAERACEHLPELLLDHAHCEKKAASTALSLIFRYPERPSLAVPLSRLAREELAHFEEVVAVMRARGLEFRRQTPSPYAAQLMSAVRKHEPAKLIDTLLCCALIEARSCERMKLLAETLPDPELEKLYRGLLASEARHFHSYVELARELGIVGDEELQRRLAELAVHEAEVLRGEAAELRMHSAAPAVVDSPPA